MNILDNASMREADRITIEELGVPSLDLMERAGQAVARHALAMLGGPGVRIAVVCGKGNNGGDGLVAARLLRATGADVTAFVLAPEEALTADGRVNMGRARDAHVPVLILEPGAFAPPVDFDLVIDAIFGTGLTRAVAPPWDAAVAAINAARRPVLAVDMPSGLSGSSGEILGETVRATRTVALQCPKWPHVLHPAHTRCGEVVVADIGIAPAAIARASIGARLVTAADALAAFPPRPLESHKATFGRLLVVAGSRAMPGAALLAAHGALMGGAGLITLASVPALQGPVAARFPDVLHLALPETDDGTITQEAAALLRDREATAALLGPGLSRVPLTAAMAISFMRECRAPMVIDADGLNALADTFGGGSLPKRKAPTVITPHPGELRRLAGGALEGDRVEQARRMARAMDAVVVLKGHRTVVAEPGGAASICLTGTPALARGGSGDVLGGFLASILARAIPAAEAARAAVYLHGLAGEILARRLGEHMVAASALADALPAALAEATRRAASRSDDAQLLGEL